MTTLPWRRVGQIAVALAATLLLTLLFRALGASINDATVGFSYICLVIAIARVFGRAEALLATLAAGAQFDYWFLPPAGTIAIADPRNWVGLLAFLVTAALAAGLASSMRHNAAEAEQRRLEVSRLYALSRAGLLAEPGETVLQLERALVSIFSFDDVWIELPGRPPPAAAMFPHHWPLRIGQRQLGFLHAAAAGVGDDLAATITGIAAIALERARVLKESSRFEILRESEALKSALLDSVTHDIRTPLTSIKAAVTTLLTTLPRPGGAPGELLAVIEEECDYLNEVLQNLVDMARIESGDLRPALKPRQLGSIIDETLARVRIPAAQVRLSLPPSLPPIEADGLLLSQALGQLLANAAAYGGAGNPIEIRVREEAAAVVTEVHDQGPGIGADAMQHIFEKFYRDPRARRLRPAGLGMGLAIARGIVEAHHGELRAESQPGRGTRVWFSLPKSPAAARAAQPE